MRQCRNKNFPGAGRSLPDFGVGRRKCEELWRRQRKYSWEEEKKDPLASPLLKEDIGRMPRTCIIAAECDPLVDQGLMYAAKLQDAGVEVEYHMMKGMIHGFLNWTYRSSFEAMDRIIENVNR